MQTKTTMRYYFTPMTMAITGKMEDKKCRWRHGETETLVHCWWRCKMVQPPWKTVLGTVPQMAKHRLPCDSVILPVLEKETATHSSILAWEIPWTEESGGLHSMGLQRVGHDWVAKGISNIHESKFMTWKGQSKMRWNHQPWAKKAKRSSDG